MREEKWVTKNLMTMLIKKVMEKLGVNVIKIIVDEQLNTISN
jgi:hypothetical protein